MNLEQLLKEVIRILAPQEKALKRLGIDTVEDLLYHFPTRYGDVSGVSTISSLTAGNMATVFGKIGKLKTGKAFRKKMTMSEGVVEDDTGTIKIIWFNQPYIAKMLQEDSLVRVEGKVSARTRSGEQELYFSNPKVESVSNIPVGTDDSLFAENSSHHLYPVYPESKGVTSNWIYHKIQNIFSSRILDTLEDPIPESILKTYQLPNLKTALVWIHTPQKKSHAEAARKRFAFQEIFFIQVERQKSRLEFQEKKAFTINKDFKDIETFVKKFPFKATQAQRKSIEHILADFKRGHPMARLLEGDVGSGKTAVAAAAAYAATTSKPTGQDYGTLQTAYMVPTEILAQQHFESFIKYFKHLPINIALITGTGCRKFPSKVNPEGWTDISRAQLLKWVKNGEIAILIGTHALIQKSVEFKHLALAIIDEQHRFGTAQRQKLAKKSENTPHLLSMTATPIPRTLALTVYGDLDLSLLDEMPAGRKQIITEIVTPEKRSEAYTHMRKELETGRQMYVICPRIAEPDPEKPARPHEGSGAGGEQAVLAKSVKEEAKRLKNEVFPEYEIEILHSKMKPSEKEDVMMRFKNGEIDILVSTSVVEVGVNVENASLIIIEGAERFGLAQLHQLRGRVLRGTHQPYCFIFADTKSAKTIDRMKALKLSKNGFELAEFDLAQRGAGELAGTKQWGISDLGMEAIKNIRMVEAAREEARKIIESDPELKRHPLIKRKLDSSPSDIHFE